MPKQKVTQRYNQLSRFYRVLKLLEIHKKGLSSNEIFEKIRIDYPVTKRSIYRDLEALTAAGFSVYKESKKNDAKWILETTHIPQKQTKLNPREILALIFSEKTLLQTSDKIFQSDLSSALNKIRKHLDASSLKYFESLNKNVHVTQAIHSKHEKNENLVEIINAIQASIDENQCLEIFYQSSKDEKSSQRKICPEFIFQGKGNTYLVARDEKNKTKTYALNRISSARLLDERFQSSNLDPIDFFENSIGVFSQGDGKSKNAVTVTLLFDKKIARFVAEKTWHRSQKTTLQKNGSLQLILKVDPFNDEFLSWILSFGSKVRVIGPEKLKNEIDREIKKMKDS